MKGGVKKRVVAPAEEETEVIVFRAGALSPNPTLGGGKAYERQQIAR